MSDKHAINGQRARESDLNQGIIISLDLLEFEILVKEVRAGGMPRRLLQMQLTASMLVVLERLQDHPRKMQNKRQLSSHHQNDGKTTALQQ